MAKFRIRKPNPQTIALAMQHCYHPHILLQLIKVSMMQILPPPEKFNKNRGFTLIELSIVLVIIGLIIGGILVGRDLIKSAEIRAQISQIDKYNTAVNTFYGKFGALPGDISSTLVTRFGFTVVPTRAGTEGQGDGNGLIEGFAFPNTTAYPWVTSGETAWFWEDLSANSGLIDQNFHTAATSSFANSVNEGTVPAIHAYIPYGKITGLYVYVYSYNEINYFGLSSVYELDSSGSIYNYGINPGLSVIAAYNIDKKMDDGLPQTGKVTAQYMAIDIVDGPPTWAQGPGVDGPSGTTQTPGNSTTCYDNNNTPGGTQQYSVEQNGGTSPNCALSFQMSAPGR